MVRVKKNFYMYSYSLATDNPGVFAIVLSLRLIRLLENLIIIGMKTYCNTSKVLDFVYVI